MSYGRIDNPSRTLTMRATLNRPGCVAYFDIPPHETLPVAGSVAWHLWTLEWLAPPPPPRKGLMRFRR